MSSAPLEVLERLDWHDDRMVLDDLVFRLEGSEGAASEPGSESFRFHKGQPIVSEYADLLAANPTFRPQRIFEIGIWDGGSTAFWFEVFDPLKLVAVDLLSRGDSDYYRRFLEQRGAEDRIATFWSTDQSDKERLREIVAESFDGPLDLVIDDGSHLYGPTKASFEALFPLLAPGGLYVVEDWPWGHQATYRDPSHPWSGETPLTELVVDLVRAFGSAPSLIRRVDVFFAFFVVVRGYAPIDDAVGFSVDRLVAESR